MILVNDPYNLVPELFTAYSEFEKDSKAMIDILPVTADESTKTSTNFTVFIEPEPTMHNAHNLYIWQKYQRPNHIFAVSGFGITVNWQVPYVLYFANLITTLRVNTDVRKVELEPKKYIANALLGGQSRYRGRILSQLRSNNLLEQCLVNYHARSLVTDEQRKHFERETLQSYRSPDLDQLDNQTFVKVAFDSDSNTGNTCRPIPDTKPFQNAWVSQLIPYEIYNNCYICIVTETEGSPDEFFVSEKIAKPLILGQPFVVFGGYKYLEHLRNLGIQTFAPYIDESYDNIKDYNKRVDTIIDSVKKFASLHDHDRIKLLERLNPIVEHNRRLVLNYQWTLGPLANVIKSNFKPA